MVTYGSVRDKSCKNHKNWEWKCWKKNEKKCQELCFFLAATSENLFEVSLFPLPILFTCGIYFISLISFHYLIFVCAEVQWFLTSCFKKRLMGVLKIARNQFKEIFYMEFISLAFHTSLDILMLVQDIVLNFFFFNVKRRRRKSLNLR